MCSHVVIDLKRGFPLEPTTAYSHTSTCIDLLVAEKDRSITNLKCICNLIGSYQNDVIECVTSPFIDKLLKLSCEDDQNINLDEQCLVFKILGNLICCSNLEDEFCRKIWSTFCDLFNRSFEHRAESLPHKTLDVLFMIVNGALRHRLSDEFLKTDFSFLDHVLNVCFFSKTSETEWSNFNTVLVHTVIDLIPNYPRIFHQLDSKVQLALIDVILDESGDLKMKEDLALFLFSDVFEPNFAKLAAEDVCYNWSQATIFHNSIKIFCEWSTNDCKLINDVLPTLNCHVLKLVEAYKRWDFQNFDTDSTDLTIDGNKPQVFHGFLSDLIRLLANLVYKNKEKQDECHPYLPLLLGNFKIEDRNPYLREWNILLLRNMLENNTRNQKFVHDLKPEEILPSSVLDKLSPTADLRNMVFKE